MAITLRACLFGLAGVALAGLATLDAAANVMREKLPKAVEMFPGETQAQVEVLDTQFRNRLVAAPPARTFPIARRALRDEPLNPTALHLMAFSVDRTGQSPAAVEYARLADMVTRRDFFAQLILIDAYARKGDSKRALDHYDAALRAHPNARPAVFAILKKALVSPGIRRDLSAYLIGRSPWAVEFISAAALDKDSVDLIADTVLHAGKRIHAKDMEVLGPLLLTRLLQARKFDKAGRVLALMPGGDPELLTSAEWTDKSIGEGFGMANWQVVSSATSSANFRNDPAAGGKSISIFAGAGSQDVVLSKILYLKPGTYALRQMLGMETPPAPGQAAIWRLFCLYPVETKEVWRSSNLVKLPDVVRIGGIGVPQGCRHQRLDLEMQIDFDSPALDITIGGFRLDRVGSAPAAAPAKPAAPAQP